MGDKEFGFQVVHEAVAFLGDGIGPVVGKNNRGTDWWYELMQVAVITNIPHICHFFTRAKFLENKIYTEKTRKLRQITQ